MKDYIKKWWNREWSNWKIDFDFNYKVILKRTSNDGLIEFKEILKG